MIVREEGVKWAFLFAPGAHVWIRNGAIKFYNFDSVSEIAIDEDEKAGRKSHGKLDFSK